MTGLSAAKNEKSGFRAVLRALSDWIAGPSASGVCCGELEIEQIARDLHMSPAELRAVTGRGSDAANLLLKRMAALDLDPVEVAHAAPESFRDLQRVCSLCGSKRRCERDLAQDLAAPQRQSYCPNAQALMALDALSQESRRPS